MSEDNKEKDKKFDITFDTSQTNEIIRENERLKLAQAQKDNEDLADKKIQAFQKFHQERFLDATSKDELTAMLTSHINTLAEQSKGTPSGSAPLNLEQFGQKPEDLYTRKFSSNYELVSHLIDLSHGNSPQSEEAKSYLNSLMKKYVLDKKHHPERLEGFHDPNSVEALQELDLVQKGEVLTPRNPKDGDLGKIFEAWRQERKKKMEEGAK